MDELKLVSESFEDALLERKKAKKKPTKKQHAKVAKTMHHWKEGKQHIGKSEKFVPVTKKGQKQAVAIALSQAGLSKKKKVNEDVTTTEMVGDAQYAKDIQMITVKYNRDLQTLNDNFARLKAQAMTNLTTRQQQAQQKAAVATPPQQTTNTQQQQQPQQTTESFNLLQFVDDDKLDEAHESSILIPKETNDYYDEPIDNELGAEPIEDDEVTRDTLKSDDEWEEENLVFYVLLDDKGEDVIAKIYREDEESDWIVEVKKGSNEILDNMAFYKEYDKVQIISYLAEIFDGVEELTEKDYNEFLEEPEAY